MNSRWIYTLLPESPIEVASRRAVVATPQAGHFHDEVQIVCVQEGWRAFLTPVGEYRAEAGDVLVIPARMPHAPRMSERSSVTNLYVDSADPAVRSIVMPFEMQGVRAARSSDLIDLIDLIGSLSATRLARSRGEDTANMRTIIADTDLAIAEVAWRLEFSTDGFIRAFRRAVGVTPARYRRMHRLCTARRMLRSGAKPADAAFAASFADQSHLGRLFLRAFGTTAAAYRSGFLHSREVDFIPD